MATHQAHLSLQRAPRRSRRPLSLPAYAAFLCGGSAVGGAVATWTALTRLRADGATAIAFGLAAAFLVMVIAAALARRVAAALSELTGTAHLAASGDLRPGRIARAGSEIASLVEAFNQMVVSFSEDRRRLQALVRSLEEQLRGRSAEADERSRELESFLYAASHDLRAPVLSIQGFATLLERNLRRRLDADSREHLSRIKSNAEAMDLLLRDLLEVSRVGRVQEAVEWVDSGEIVASVLRDLEPEIARLAVRVKVADRLPVVAASPRLLARVFRNLVDNAIKFMGDQPMPSVAIGSEPLAEGHRLWVRDNGVGIEPDDTDRIFGLFTRARGTKAPGSGIGLAIVRRIVETYGGRICVQSDPGRGSTFSFTVPAAHPDNGGPGHHLSS